MSMSPPRVYADFNAIEYTGDGKTAEIALTGYGTLASLARQRLHLVEGMALLLYEPNDIECEAVVYFDSSRRDPAGRKGEWVARIDDHRMTRSSFAPEELSNEHPCSVCGTDFAVRTTTVVRNYTESCPKCGASVMAPLAPPKDAT